MLLQARPDKTDGGDHRDADRNARKRARETRTNSHSPNENKMSDGYRCKTIRRECVNPKKRIALGKPTLDEIKARARRAGSRSVEVISKLSLGDLASQSKQAWYNKADAYAY